MMRDRVPGHGTTLSVSGSPDHTRPSPEKEKEKEKEGTKVYPKKGGGAFLGAEQAQDSEMWSEENFAWWNKGRKGKKGLSKSNDGLKLLKKNEKAMLGNLLTGHPVNGLMILGLKLEGGTARELTLHGRRYPL